MRPLGGSSSTWFLIELEFGTVGIWGGGVGGGEGVPSGEISRSNGENQQQTRPTYGVDASIWTRTTLVGGECSLTEPPFLPYILIVVNMIASLFKTQIGGPALVCELTHISI